MGAVLRDTRLSWQRWRIPSQKALVQLCGAGNCALSDPAARCRFWALGLHPSLRSPGTWLGFLKKLYFTCTRQYFLRFPFNFSINYFSSKKYSVTEHVCEHGLLAMFVHCYTLIYVLSFAHRLKMFSCTPQNGSKAIEEIIEEMKHSCSVHSVCAAAQWQLKCHLKYRFKFCTGTTKAVLIPSNLRSSTQQAPTSSMASKCCFLFTASTRLQKRHK